MFEYFRKSHENEIDAKPVIAKMRLLIPGFSSELRRYKFPLTLEKIILFGSYAQGYPRIDSDIDLAVVFLYDKILLSPLIEHKITKQVDHAREQFATRHQFPLALLHITTLTTEYLKHPDEYAIAKAINQHGIYT